MKRLVLESWLLLLCLEAVMRVRDFKSLHRIVRDYKRHTPLRGVPPSSEEMCRAMDLACVFYFKHVLCLQRSAATTILLRRYGWAAELVIGAQMMPFRSHAWVEIGDSVVNDKPYLAQTYQVLERC
jgi:Transglutaminase-like superfamily